MKSSLLRQVASSVLADRGFDVRIKVGQGYLPGSRVVLAKDGKKIQAAVKASQARMLGFTRQSDRSWRTLRAVGLVIAIVPSRRDPAGADVLAFPKRSLVRVFDRAWKALETAKRPIGLNMPVFVPLDPDPRKNVGHGVRDIKRLAIWSIHLTAAELAARTSLKLERDYVIAFRRRYAAEHGVDVSAVKILIEGDRNDQ